jgi:hypothetical protein
VGSHTKKKERTQSNETKKDFTESPKKAEYRWLLSLPNWQPLSGIWITPLPPPPTPLQPVDGEPNTSLIDAVFTSLS